jgi:hypothetical protein
MDHRLLHNGRSIRARSRSRRHGAVMVEGLAVISFLLLLLACIIFVHRLYTAKLATITEARTDAWLGALPGCGGGIVGGILDGIEAFVSLADDATPGMDLPDWAGDNEVGRSPGRSRVRQISGCLPRVGFPQSWLESPGLHG